MIVVLAVALGALLRVPWVTEADFPLNDGGLFYAMVRDLQAASYALPDFTSYNAGDLPFAYPPLMLYAAAALDDLGPWSLLDVFLFVPALLGVASILAFAALARAVLGRGLAAAVATLAYALLPMSSMWLTMGGGLTRSAGALFSLLALYQATLLFQRGQRRYIATTAVLSALTVLSHPETALFTAYSAVLLFFAFGPSWGSFRNAVVVSIGVLVLASPWWLSVVARHGVEPFLVLGDDGSAWLSGPKELLLLSGVTHEDLFPFLAMLAVLGVLGSLRDRRYLLPVWLVLPYLLQGRSADQRAVVPIAMLVGVAVIEVLPALLPAAFSRARGRLSRTAQLAAGALVLYLVASTSVSLAGQLQPLDPEHREAMTWVSEHTPPSSIFLVASHGDWYRDRAAEWFPVLAGRESVATVQGQEWSLERSFGRAVERRDGLMDCAARGLDCLEARARSGELRVSHLYVPFPSTIGNPSPGDFWMHALHADLARRDYQLLFANDVAAVYATGWSGQPSTADRRSAPEAADRD